MKSKNNFPNLAFLIFMAVAISGTKLQGASNIKATSVNVLSDKALVYKRILNPYIGISPNSQSIGSTYTIINQKGRIVRTGIIKSSATFYIATGKLADGLYTFYTGGYPLQQFVLQ